MSDTENKKKSLVVRVLDWISRGTRRAEKRGQGVCRS